MLYLLGTELGRRMELQLLMNLVASALGLPSKGVMMTGSEQGLRFFAEYTATHLPTCNDAQLRRLNKKALRLGKVLRSILTDRSAEALMRVVVLLYRNIGIEMEGTFPKEVKVVRCHFCTRYNPHVCAIASAIDSGVICGLYGAGGLRFTQRITEGKDRCLCHLESEKQ